MAFFSGSHGSLYLDIQGQKNTFKKEPVAKVRSWSLSQQTETLDVTSLQDTDRNFRPGLRSYTGSAEFWYYTTQTGQSFSKFINRSFEPRKADDTPDDEFFDNTAIAKEPTTYGLKLFVADNNKGADNEEGKTKSYYIQVRCILTQIDIKVATGEVTGGSIGFQVIGAPLKVEA